MGVDFFSFWQGLLTLLFQTTYARCQTSSLSNRLYSCGSLEGRSFILFPTLLYPEGICSSWERSVLLLWLFMSLRRSFGCVSGCRGCGRDGKGKVSYWLVACAGSSDWFMYVCLALFMCAHTGSFCTEQARGLQMRICILFFQHFEQKHDILCLLSQILSTADWKKRNQLQNFWCPASFPFSEATLWEEKKRLGIQPVFLESKRQNKK